MHSCPQGARPIVGVTLVTPLFQHARYALLPSGCKANCGCDPGHSSIPACSLCTPSLRVQGQWVVTLVTPLFQHARYALLPSGRKANCGCDPSIPACSLSTPALRVQGLVWSVALAHKPTAGTNLDGVVSPIQVYPPRRYQA